MWSRKGQLSRDIPGFVAVCSFFNLLHWPSEVGPS